MTKEIRTKRYELLQKSIMLNDLSKEPKLNYQKSKEVKDELDKAYKHYKFFDGFLKASCKNGNL